MPPRPRPPRAEKPQLAELQYRHSKVQRLRRLLGRRSTRQAEGAFVAEGSKLLSEALDAGIAVEGVYVAAGHTEEVVERALAAGIRVHELGAGVLERVADTVTPQPVVAVVPAVDRDLAAIRGADWIVVCVDVRDPGNAGTVLRSAEAAGAGAVVCCDGTVDLYNPKTVRASAGSIFHVPVVVGGAPLEVLEEMARWGLHRLATTSRSGTDYTKADLARPIALVLGNEAHGLPAEVEGAVDELVTIPMTGRTESLNVGMAAAVVNFEVARQRRSEPAGARHGV